jgi:ferredoxin
MKGILCYYSGSGNTKLACHYLAHHIHNADITLCDMVKQDMPDFSHYAAAGFATFTDFGTVSEYVKRYFEQMPAQTLPAFVLSTYGALPLVTLRDLADLARAKGFQVIGGHALHTPENYPPMRMRKMAHDDAPKPKELAAFTDFIRRLDQQLATLASGQTPPAEPIKVSLVQTLLTKLPYPKGKKDMGEQWVEAVKCTECGVCEQRCPYGAITLQPKPVFDHQRCYACWACYNHCPEQAIYTPKLKGEGQYARPNEALRQKLAVS